MLASTLSLNDYLLVGFRGCSLHAPVVAQPRQALPLTQCPAATDPALDPVPCCDRQLLILLQLQGPHSPAPLFEVPEQAVISLAARKTDSTPEAARPEGLELPTAGADSLQQAPV